MVRPSKFATVANLVAVGFTFAAKANDAGRTAGSGMSGQEFRKRLAALGFSQTAFARRLVELGDPRSVEQVLRSISNYASGATKVPGFVIVILNLMDASDAARGEVSGRRMGRPKKGQTVP
jgi:hypothetical protein